MILRVLFALVSLAILSALLYFRDSDSSGGETAGADTGASEPGFAAVRAQLVETGQDGIALYRLDAERIEQPQPQGPIFLTDPKLNYQPEAGNQWTLTALHGQMPEDARTAELNGNVHAEGVPGGSDRVMRLDTDQLHLDMAQQLATSASNVRVDWGGNRLSGHGMRADLKNYRLQLASKVHGVLLH
jgi:LPS export ABC transporter protein LptC